MSTTSQKHRNFVAEPMNEKPVTDLAGIGEVLGKRLQNKGFDKVSQTSCHTYFKVIEVIYSGQIKEFNIISSYFSGIRCVRTIPCLEEKSGSLCGLVEGRCRCQ